MRSAIYKGSDVRLSTGKSLNPMSARREAFPALRLKWRTLIGVPTKPDHINVLEMRGHLLGLRWRSRSKHFINSRFIHLLDSQVTIGVVSKGRSSSKKLLHLLRRISAIMLTADASGFFPYVAFGVNPADVVSRWDHVRK